MDYVETKSKGNGLYKITIKRPVKGGYASTVAVYDDVPAEDIVSTITGHFEPVA